jgi:hypothetical protein
LTLSNKVIFHVIIEEMSKTQSQWLSKEKTMCRNIKTLFNFAPPATDEELKAASLQFVRKISGFNVPSKANEEAFNLAVEEVTLIARNLMDTLVTQAEPRNREIEKERARIRSVKRFGNGNTGQH